MQGWVLIVSLHGGVAAGRQVAAAALDTVRQKNLAAVTEDYEHDEPIFLAQRELPAVRVAGGVRSDGPEVGLDDDDAIIAAAKHQAEDDHQDGTQHTGNAAQPTLARFH